LGLWLGRNCREHPVALPTLQIVRVEPEQAGTHSNTQKSKISPALFYRSGVEEIFAGQADFAQMIKLYGDYGQRDAAGRYSPAPLIETIVKIRDGRPDSRHISTGFVERQNLTIRMAIRRPALHPLDQCFLEEARQS
jgi:hypothetical protein